MSDSDEKLVSNSKPHKKLFLLLFTSFLIIAAVIGIVAGVNSKKNAIKSSSTHAIVKSSCSTTFYPDLCYSTIANATQLSNKVISAPKDVIMMSLNITKTAVEHNYFSVKRLLKRKKLTDREKTALHDCLEMIDETLDEIRKAEEDLNQYPSYKKSLSQHADDLKTLMSAAMTNQETCVDGFSYNEADKKDKDVGNLSVVITPQLLQDTDIKPPVYPSLPLTTSSQTDSIFAGMSNPGNHISIGMSDSGSKHTSPSKPRKKLILLLFTSFLLVAAAVIGIVAGVNSRENVIKSSSTHSIVKSSCSTTFYPDLCYSTIANAPELGNKAISTPKDVIATSLNATKTAAEKNYFSVKRLLKKTGLTGREKTALHDCLETIDETLDELRKAEEDLNQYPSFNKSLTRNADDLKTLSGNR
ncbi:hypothetical protein RHMOL_Rhmol08G0320500 [Rhododendron molle]|uniref:Uncharacterized protein n=1 Tax=Rhododendron molle TaxID=49168 RepID=A0ACC0MWB4_RHOML|nr:hypothetical protein RHMOL_Rhmol08G0320500 [Rhododendron molle]